jgi:hypothetical protein
MTPPTRFLARRRAAAALAGAAVAALAGVAAAGIMAFETRLVPLAKGKVLEGTTWSDGWTLGDRMLESPKIPKDGAADVWVESAPVPAGLAWRPPRVVSVELFVEGTGDPGVATVGLVEAYVRHGCDLVHWSSWQLLGTDPEGPYVKSGTPAEPGGAPVLLRFHGDVGVPSTATREWYDRHDAWVATGPDWASDDDEYARWLAAKDPTFFTRNLPFVGWMQFRVEWESLSMRVRLTALHARLGWSVGGGAARPKVAKPGKDRKNWSLDLRPRPAPAPK